MTCSHTDGCERNIRMRSVRVQVRSVRVQVWAGESYLHQRRAESSSSTSLRWEPDLHYHRLPLQLDGRLNLWALICRLIFVRRQRQNRPRHRSQSGCRRCLRVLGRLLQRRVRSLLQRAPPTFGRSLRRYNFSTPQNCRIEAFRVLMVTVSKRPLLRVR